jgi:hypothetical protein
VIAWWWAACGGAGAPVASPEPPCDPVAVDQLAERHGMQLVFAPCGSNQVLDAAWSPTGHEVFYALGMTQHVLHADRPDRLTEIVPTPSANGAAVFLSAVRIAHPAPPEHEGAPPRLAWWDLDTPRSTDPEHPTVGKTVALPAGTTEPADLQRTRDPDHVLLTARRDGGPRQVWEVDLTTGAMTAPWSFLGEVDSFTYTPAADAIVTVRNGTATWWDAATGQPRGTWSPATRGVVHARGGWMMLEHDGPSVSVFGPEDPDAERKAASLPEADREVRPPMLSLVDLRTGSRYELTLFHGSQFEWYESTDYYGSFVLWGFQQRRMRRNLALMDFLERMTGAEIGALPQGLRAVGEKEGFLGALTSPPAAPTGG